MALVAAWCGSDVLGRVGGWLDPAWGNVCRCWGLERLWGAGGRTRGVPRPPWRGHGLAKCSGGGGRDVRDLALGSTHGAFQPRKHGEDLVRGPRAPRLTWGFVVHPAGFEPAAVGLEVRCSIH